jgi:MraZ protein
VLFTGQSEHSIDAKQRLAIPAKYRNQWDAARDGGAWICIPWPTGHLRLYTESTFAALAKQSDASLTPDEDLAELQTTLFGLAERLEMDSAGRINLPQQHLKLAGLSSEVSIVGAGDRLEVRSRGEWTSATQDRFQALPTLVQRIQQRRALGGSNFSPPQGRS